MCKGYENLSVVIVMCTMHVISTTHYVCYVPHGTVLVFIRVAAILLKFPSYDDRVLLHMASVVTVLMDCEISCLATCIQCNV